MFLEDPDVNKKLSNCMALSVVNPSEYDAIFYVGGEAKIYHPGVSIRCPCTPLTLCRVRSGRRPRKRHQEWGPRFGGEPTFPTQVLLSAILMAKRTFFLQFWQAGKIVSAVCHGPALVFHTSPRTIFWRDLRRTTLVVSSMAKI